MRPRATHPVAWALVAVATALGLGIAVSTDGELSTLDRSADLAVYAHTSTSAAHWVSPLSALGSSYPLMAVAVASGLALTLRGRWRLALRLVLAYVLTDVTVTVVKLIVARPRPHPALTETTGFSFPSGHAAMSMAVYGALTFGLVSATRGRRRIAAALGGASLVIAIGLTRIYLGAHYPSDVVAGWATGAAILILTWVLVPGGTKAFRAPGRRGTPKAQARPGRVPI